MSGETGETTVPIEEQLKKPNRPDYSTKRARVLDQMTQIAQAEPNVALNIPTEAAYEYTSSHIVQETKDPELKAELAIIWINEMIEEGNYADAVNSLVGNGIPESNIPEMQNANFVGSLFEKAQTENNTYQAHKIAETVVQLEKKGERNKLFKTPIQDSKFNEGWETRETLLFEKGIKEELTKATETGKSNWQVHQQVLLTHNSWNFREDGYYSDHPNPLAIKTAKVFCEILSDLGEKQVAYQTAVESKLPLADLLQYESDLPKKQQVKNRLTRHYSALVRKVQDNN